MSYVIQYESEKDGFCDGYVMNGWSAPLIGDHLKDIARQNNIVDNAISESHLLFILRNNGIEIELLDEDGSELIW